ncbi:MAG: DUF1501 domain-containing protein [Gemmataceae bacterium]|nr:DUF1501 domain-containing protein [Gemmataceae bacterium]
MDRTARLLLRRRFLQMGGGLLGLHLGGLWQAQAAPSTGGFTPPARRNPIRSCILVFYYGGPSHLDTYDLKPNAPAEIRGEFRTIATSAPGIRICEHLPRMARVMHRVALIRSMHHEARLHDSASIHALTGRPLEGPDRELFAPQPQTFPSFGSAVARLRQGPPAEILFASVPFPFRNVHDVPCQGAGFLGAAFDPLRIDVNPQGRRYGAEALAPAADVPAARLQQRRALLDSLQRGGQTRSSLHGLYDRAFRLLDSQALRTAVDLSREPAAVRERYGFGPEPLTVGEGGGGGNGAELGYARQMRGQHLLLARRLVEAGVPFVNVYDFRQQGQNWDAHFRCFNQHRTHLLPLADQSLSALIEDLDQRGLLGSTLVVALGEFGRTPRINRDGGRDHWPDCYTVLLAGGGVCGGAVYGASDRQGAYPALDPVTPGDLAATIFWRFGIDPSAEIRDQAGRPYRVAEGEPLTCLFGSA